jgi:hypothetical protein
VEGRDRVKALEDNPYSRYKGGEELWRETPKKSF